MMQGKFGRRTKSRRRHHPLAPVARTVSQFALLYVAGPRPPLTGLDEIQENIQRIMTQCLAAPTPQGRELRMALMKMLLETEPLFAGIDRYAWRGRNDPLITTAEAARLLEVSRTHVVMLAEFGKLGEVHRTEGGHRRLRTSAVRAFLAQQTRG